jgi:hypothetical protein
MIIFLSSEEREREREKRKLGIVVRDTTLGGVEKTKKFPGSAR